MKKNSIAAMTLASILICVLLVIFSQKKYINPEQSISLVHGNTVRLKQLLQQKDTFIVFWATSCSSCILELAKLNTEKKGNNKLNVIAIAMQYDEIDKIEKFIHLNKYDFYFSYDKDGSIAKSFDNVNLTPTAFKINKKGLIEKKMVGEIKSTY